VQLPGVRLHVAQAGAGEPLVLLHGWPQHWFSWRHLIGPLSERYTVIAPDLRGWGWSEAPPGDYAKATFAADIIALLDHEGIERARVIGHDWGAWTAFLLALDHPERIERMVALDIVPPWPERPRLRHALIPVFLIYQVLIASPLGVPLMTRSTRFVREIIRLASGTRLRWSLEELDVYADVLREPARARASSSCYRTFLTREALSRSRRRGQLTVPTLLLMGQASALRRIFDPQPGGQLKVESIAGAGHFLAEEAPDEVLARALTFLGD
jgi:pimeloyl-ACP methyl ester carboxylesterase